VNDVSKVPEREMVAGTDVPELPLLAPGVYIKSRDVPKSESIASGLRGLQDTRITNRIYAYMRVAPSRVGRTLPGFKSRRRTLYHAAFPKDDQHRAI